MLVYKGYNILITDHGYDLGLDCVVLPASITQPISRGTPEYHKYNTEEEKQRLVEELIQKAKDKIDANLLK